MILLTWLNKGEKCGFVFEWDSVPGDFPARCPECGYSKTEEIREKGRRK
jgi:predicted Zn-ribbon and HTH transcriptional regulator